MYNKAFEVETEGHLLDGSKVKVYSDDDVIKEEFVKGQNDNIWLIHEILSDKMLDNPLKEFADEEVYTSSSHQSAYTPIQQYSPVAAAQPSQPQPTTFQVQLPAGIVAGQQIHVQHPKTNQMLVITVPGGVPVGGVFNVCA